MQPGVAISMQLELLTRRLTSCTLVDANAATKSLIQGYKQVKFDFARDQDR